MKNETAALNYCSIKKNVNTKMETCLKQTDNIEQLHMCQS